MANAATAAARTTASRLMLLLSIDPCPLCELLRQTTLPPQPATAAGAHHGNDNQSGGCGNGAGRCSVASTCVNGAMVGGTSDGCRFTRSWRLHRLWSSIGWMDGSVTDLLPTWLITCHVV